MKAPHSTMWRTRFGREYVPSFDGSEVSEDQVMGNLTCVRKNI